MVRDELTLAIQRFPLADYVQEYGADREGRREWMLYCPQCSKYKLSVNVEKRQWRCFACEVYDTGVDGMLHAVRGAGGVFSLVQWLEGGSNADTARRIIAIARETETAGNGLIPDANFAEPERAVIRHPTGLPENCIAVTTVLPYMERRRISLEDARIFGLGWVPHGCGWLSNRLVFPVWERGTCVYWQARACWDAHEHVPRWLGRNADGEEDKFRKTLNPSTHRHGVDYLGSADVLGNLEQAARYPRPCLVEGPTSGVRVGPDAVWTFGKQLQPAQVGRLIASGIREIDFMWDGPSDKEPHGAWPQMIRAAAILAPHMRVHLVFLPVGDPGNYEREHLAYYRRQARPFGEQQTNFLW